MPLFGKKFLRCAPVSRSSPEWAETGYGLGGPKRNKATVPALPGDAISFRDTNTGTPGSYRGLDSIAITTVPYALVIDDELPILVGACDILEAAGFSFHETGTGEEATTLLADHADDATLFFTDVEMPGDTDGLALVHYVAEHWPWIVIASGDVKPGSGDMPYKATFIGKPFNDRMVHQHLRETLPDNKQPEQAI